MDYGERNNYIEYGKLETAVSLASLKLLSLTFHKSASEINILVSKQ